MKVATTIYQVTNRTSGAVVWTGEAASPDDALNAMAKDAGYSDYASACLGEDEEMQRAELSVSTSDGIGGRPCTERY